MDRRSLLTGAVAAGAMAALPGRAFAQAFSVSEQHRKILAIAAEQVERNRSCLWRADMAAVADFALPSALPRFHFANLEQGSVRSFLVAHGRGSDPEHDGFLKIFSNVPNSYATSRGAYVTAEWYKGKYGTSIRLVVGIGVAALTLAAVPGLTRTLAERVIAIGASLAAGFR